MGECLALASRVYSIANCQVAWLVAALRASLAPARPGIPQVGAGARRPPEPRCPRCTAPRPLSRDAAERGSPPHRLSVDHLARASAHQPWILLDQPDPAQRSACLLAPPA